MCVPKGQGKLAEDGRQMLKGHYGALYPVQLGFCDSSLNVLACFSRKTFNASNHNNKVTI